MLNQQLKLEIEEAEDTNRKIKHNSHNIKSKIRQVGLGGLFCTVALFVWVVLRNEF